MAITTFTDVHISPIHPSKVFKASIVDSHNLIPKLMPQAISSIQITEGDGGAGSIKQINFAYGGNFKSLKYRVDELDEESLVYKYTLIEGEALTDKLEKITYEVNFEVTKDGGSVSKVTSKYYTVGDFMLRPDTPRFWQASTRFSVPKLSTYTRRLHKHPKCNRTKNTKTEEIHSPSMEPLNPMKVENQ